MKKKSILIFEDDLDLAMQWDYALVNEGYDVNYTMSFHEAISFCKEKEYDLVISDIFIMEGNRLSGFGGITLLQHLRNDRMKLNWTKNVPTIIVSGAINAEEKLKKHKETYNAWGVMEKPIAINQLLTAVNAILGNSKQKVEV